MEPLSLRFDKDQAALTWDGAQPNIHFYIFKVYSKRDSAEF